MILREFITKWGFTVDDKALDQADKKLAQVKTRADSAGKSVTTAFDKPQNSLHLIQGAALSARNAILGLTAAFAGGGLGLGGFFKLIGGFEQTEIAFDTLIGDAELAKKTLNDLKVFAKATPFNFGDVAELSKRLLAFSFTAEELIPTMTALGNIAAGVGKDKLPQLILALGQVKAAGKLRGSELRQFTEAGVPLIAELAKTLGVADSKVQDLVESGAVGFKDVYKALENVTSAGGRFNNLMARQSTSLLGIFSNLVDTVQLLAVDLGNRGLLGRTKIFVRNILSMLEMNREKVLDGMQYAIELLVVGMENIIKIAKGAWQVFEGLTRVVGGTRRGLDLLLRALLIITSGRLLFSLGKMGVGVAGLAKAFVGLGNAALVSQLKIGAVAVAIGAAIAGAALIVEDIVAYFQGRNSITGLIVKEFANLSAKFDEFLEPLLNKLMVFGKKVGLSIVDGISSLTAADWSKIGDVMMKSLELLLMATTIPIRLGLAIAEGIVDGLIAGIKEKFPKLASFMGFDEGPESKGFLANLKERFLTPGVLPEEKAAWDMLKGFANTGSGVKAPIYKDASGIASPGAIGPQPVFKIDAPINVVVPAGTPPESVGPAVTDGVKQGVQGLIRETSRATSSQIVY